MNVRPGDGFKSKDASLDVSLPHYIRNGHVSFGLSVKIEAAYSYHALAQALDEFAGHSHERAKAFEAAVMAALLALGGRDAA